MGFQLLYCTKYRNFTYFPGVKILWKRHSAFPLNFHIRKLGENTVFYAVCAVMESTFSRLFHCVKTCRFSELFWSAFFLIRTEEEVTRRCFVEKVFYETSIKNTYHDVLYSKVVLQACNFTKK